MLAPAPTSPELAGGIWPRLGPRLKALARSCPWDRPVADVGSGHGRLALELQRRRPGAQVFATEWRPGPAAELRRLLGPGSPVVVLEGDGLEPLAERGCRGAVIAGMGGVTIRGILERQRQVAEGLEWLCLQPAQRPLPLLAWLAESGWAAQERLPVVERGHLYRTLLVRPR